MQGFSFLDPVVGALVLLAVVVFLMVGTPVPVINSIRSMSTKDTGSFRGRVPAGSLPRVPGAFDDPRPWCLDLLSRLVRRRRHRQRRERRPAASVGCTAAVGGPPEGVSVGSTLLGLPFTPVGGLAVQLGHRSALDCPCLASQGVSALLALEIATSGC